MAVKTYSWISLWFLIAIPVVAWDIGYCFMRPRSMVGGDLHWIWKPYGLYQDIDYIYGMRALKDGRGFTNAQSFLNAIETLMNIQYLYLAHVSGSPFANLIGFAAATMTLSKTVLYGAQEYFCNYCEIGHNTMEDILLLWILPNGLWILFPTLIVWRLGKDLSQDLQVAERVKEKASNGKNH